MSAITGLVNFNNKPIIDEGILMMSDLTRYPADDIKVWKQSNIFFCCHNQWITPESIGEKLPYYDYERKLLITADAIIDNRNELFERLQIDRESRKNMSDSQLILLAYSKWEEDSLQYLIGDFAFMIWDEKNQKLFGARDFSGTRTLYFCQNEQQFAFSTVIHPLLTLPHIEKKLNEQWLAEYLAIPNMIDSVTSSTTVIKDILQIPPSHSITVTNGKVTVSRYCKLEVNETIKFKRNDEYVEAFKDIFQEAVNARLRTDYPVGAQLTGGLDSGSVVSFTVNRLKKQNKSLHTFSYVPENDFRDWTPEHRMADERPMIKETVNYVGNIKDHYLNFEGKSPLSEMDEWLEILEMPYKFFENSVWIKGIYEEASKKGIRVLLNGDRGNLGISWGPALDYYSSLLRKMKWIRLNREINLYSKNLGGVSKSRILSMISKKAFPLLKKVGGSNSEYKLPQLINSDFAKKTSVFDKIQAYGVSIDQSSKPSIYEIRRAHFRDVFIWNTSNTSKAKLSLKNSIMSRDPTNDIRVIKYCLSIPEEQFVRNGVDRALIRRATNGLLPEKIRLNQRVRGIQGADWVHRMSPMWKLFLEELQKLTKDPISSSYLNIQFIKSSISRVEGGPRIDFAFDPDFRVLMRSVIVYRFLKLLEGR